MTKATYRETNKNSECVTWYEVNERNGKGERMVFSLVHCDNPGGNNSLPYLWKKEGYIDRILETYVCIETSVYDTEDVCRIDYNPQIEWDENKKRNVINFDWMLEDTEENRQKLIDEALRLFMSAKGKTATELKMERVYDFAKQKGLKVLDKKPEGWMIVGGSCPKGCVKIANYKFPIKRINGNLVKISDYKEAILI
jgi:hypothetical protein